LANCVVGIAASYPPYESQQQRLLPDALQDWLPEGHMAYFIRDSVDSLDLSAFHARHAKGAGRATSTFTPP
jgi:hypothetical protein